MQHALPSTSDNLINMACLLFRLNNVPEDEAEQIRGLLEKTQLEYYETSAGHWGLSFAAIWLKNEDQLEEAQTLIKAFQAERVKSARQLILKQKQAGEYHSRWYYFKSSPMRYTLVIAFSVLIFYFSIIPFF